MADPGPQGGWDESVSVHQAAGEAMAHCRAGKGPFLLEMETYRYRAIPCPTGTLPRSGGGG